MNNIIEYEELNKAKRMAHLHFDKLWREDGPYTRSRAYKLLRDYLKLSSKECHIKLFDIDTCNKVIEFTNKHRRMKG